MNKNGWASIHPKKERKMDKNMLTLYKKRGMDKN
jgi:hypothetical protein